MAKVGAVYFTKSSISVCRPNAHFIHSLSVCVDVDDLSEIQLLPDSECRQSLRRPPNIPQLNFAALSPYCEEVSNSE